MQYIFQNKSYKQHSCSTIIWRLLQLEEPVANFSSLGAVNVSFQHLASDRETNGQKYFVKAEHESYRAFLDSTYNSWNVTRFTSRILHIELLATLNILFLDSVGSQ